jgi:hypothetical protein
MANLKPFKFKRGVDTLEMTSGGGCLSLFGIPFLLAGLFIMQIPLGLIPVEQEGEPWMRLFFPLFGGIFAAVGAGLVFGRWGLILDRTRGRIVQWWGLLVPMKRKEYLIEAIGQVELDLSRGDSDTADTWPVTLSGGVLPKPIIVTQPTDFAEAHRYAEELSRFLNKPLVDSSTGERVTRDADHLDESYRDRVRRTKEASAPLPPQPPEMRTRVEHTGEGLVLHLPGPDLRWFHYFPVAISLAIAGSVAFFFLPAVRTLPMPENLRYVVLGVVGLFFVAVPVLSALLHVLRLKNQFQRITVTKTFLRVETLKQGKRSTVEMPLDELEDLTAPSMHSAMDTLETPGKKKVFLGDTGTPRMSDGRPVPRFLLSLMKLAGSKGIIARSDKAVMEFAQGLEEAETLYLFALIRKKIAG